MNARRMSRVGASAAVAAVIGVVAAGAASAHNAGPCSGEDGPTGRAYAEHHIVALATEQGLGEGGHKPGSHRGFSLCLGVHGG